MIEPTRKSIADILKMQQRVKVPSYQRDFKWGTDEARELITDLKALAESKGTQNLFLGNIIVSRQEKIEELSIVDGQQRLTTISLLLIACRTAARKIDPHHQHQADSIQRMLTFIEDSSGMSLGPRLIASPSIKEVYEHITNTRWDGSFPDVIDSGEVKSGAKGVKRQVNKIKPIYDFFVSEVSDYNFEQLKDFLEAIYGSYVVYIEINRPEEAFEIFERTNARGIELDAADLLKNFLFQQQHSAEIGQDLEDSWADIVENANGTILRMLKYFWVSRKGYVQKKSLYPNLREYGKEVTAKRLVGELLNFSEFYSSARSGDPVDIRAMIQDRGFSYINGDAEFLESLKDIFQALALFKVTQAYPLIYSALESYDKSGGKNDKKLTVKLFELLRTIEKYHFVNNVICERVGNEVERLYADFSPLFFSSTKFEKTADDLTIELNRRLAGPKEFIPRFSELRYSSADIPLICYIFDRISNFNLETAQRVKLFYPDRDIIRRSFDIEHFFPQKPAPSDKLSKIGDSVHSIGNLLIVSKRTNRNELRNLSPKDKATKLQNSPEQILNLAHVRDFLARYKPSETKWDESTIKKRALDLANQAYNEVWALRVTKEFAAKGKP